jgi:hypothetical protein
VLWMAIAIAFDALASLAGSGTARSHRFARSLIGYQLLPAGLLAIAVLLPFATPYLGRGSEPGEAAALAADWRSYLVPHDHTVVGRGLVAAGLAEPQGIWGERSVFLGWTFLALACAGALTSRGPRRMFLVILALVAAALSFGPSSTGLAPFDLLARLPGAGGFRASARFALLVTLACAVLSAFGLSWLRRQLPATRRWLPLACAILFLGETFVVQFPGGPPAREEMPEVYRLAAADGAAAAVALPMYAGEPQWFLEGDYLLYSTTAGFIPLANGIGRWVPPEYLALGEATHDFPSPDTAAALRLYGITHVIFHGARFGADAPVLLERVRQGHDFTVVATRGSDTLLRVTVARTSER